MAILGAHSGMEDKQEEGPVMPRGSLTSTSGWSLLGVSWESPEEIPHADLLTHGCDDRPSGQDSELSQPRAWVQSKLGELRSHQPVQKKKSQSGNSVQNSKMRFPSWGQDTGIPQGAAQLQWPRWALRPVCRVAWQEGAHMCLHLPPAATLSLSDPGVCAGN